MVMRLPIEVLLILPRALARGGPRRGRFSHTSRPVSETRPSTQGPLRYSRESQEGPGTAMRSARRSARSAASQGSSRARVGSLFPPRPSSAGLGARIQRRGGQRGPVSFRHSSGGKPAPGGWDRRAGRESGAAGETLCVVERGARPRGGKRTGNRKTRSLRPAARRVVSRLPQPRDTRAAGGRRSTRSLSTMPQDAGSRRASGGVATDGGDAAAELGGHPDRMRFPSRGRPQPRREAIRGARSRAAERPAAPGRARRFRCARERARGWGPRPPLAARSRPRPCAWGWSLHIVSSLATDAVTMAGRLERPVGPWWLRRASSPWAPCQKPTGTDARIHSTALEDSAGRSARSPGRVARLASSVAEQEPCAVSARDLISQAEQAR